MTDHRNDVKQYCLNSNKKYETRIHENGRYRLEIDTFKTKEGCWDYTRGTVFRDGVLLHEVHRNYSDFWQVWLLDVRGEDFLLCGEDYQGLTLLNLTTGARQDWLPEGAANGWGFCVWTAMTNPSKTAIMLEGCYWGGSPELHLHDMREMKLPWPRVRRFDEPLEAIDGDGTLFHFSDDNKVTLRCEFVKHPITGKLKPDWTEEEVQEWLDSAEDYGTEVKDITYDLEKLYKYPEKADA